MYIYLLPCAMIRQYNNQYSAITPASMSPICKNITNTYFFKYIHAIWDLMWQFLFQILTFRQCLEPSHCLILPYAQGTLLVVVFKDKYNQGFVLFFTTWVIDCGIRQKSSWSLHIVCKGDLMRWGSYVQTLGVTPAIATRETYMSCAA